MSNKEQGTSLAVFLMIGFLVAIRLQTTEAFVASVVNNGRYGSSVEPTCGYPNLPPPHLSLNEYSEASDDAIEKLILSISKEPTDNSRRARLKTIFDEKIRSDKDQADQFSSQFNKVLITVGDRIKLEVASEAQNAKRNHRDIGEEEDTQQTAEKSETALQLWALVDMMVQSKTIVKKKALR